MKLVKRIAQAAAVGALLLWAIGTTSNLAAHWGINGLIVMPFMAIDDSAFRALGDMGLHGRFFFYYGPYVLLYSLLATVIR